MKNIPESVKAYKEKTAKIEALLKKIKSDIAEQDMAVINWGHVGSMSYVLDQLTEIDRFINGVSE